MPAEKKPIHTLVVYGCECEPYLTTDYRLMVEAPDAIVSGAMLASRAVGAQHAVIGIENNKLEAVAALRRSAAGAGVHIAVLKTKYPQGSEKHLIKAVLDREVPLGVYAGQVVVGSMAPIRGLKVSTAALESGTGGTIPASAIEVRYPVPSETEAWQAPSTFTFDGLEETPPAEVPVHEPSGGAVQPIWLTLHVPADAASGEYTGSVTVAAEGAASIRVLTPWRTALPSRYTKSPCQFD